MNLLILLVTIKLGKQLLIYNKSGWSKTEDVMADLESEAALTADDFKDLTTDLEL